MDRKGILQVVFGDVETKVPNKQFCTHLFFTVRDSLLLFQTVPAYRVSNHH
jgi:hypothetical protein